MLKHVILLLGVTLTLGEEVDLFSSTAEMEKLFQREQEFSDKLESHLKTVEKQLKALDWFLDTNYKNYNYTEEDAEEYVSNPINTYVLLKRTALYWPQVKAVIFNQTAEKELDELIEILDKFPDESNIEGAFNGLFLLHETYDLNLKEVAAGKIKIPGTENYIETDFKLFPKDLKLLGQLSFNRGFYDRAYEFLSVALDLAKENGNEEEAKDIGFHLQTVMKKHDEILVKKGPRGNDWKTYQLPFDDTLRSKKKFKVNL